MIDMTESKKILIAIKEKGMRLTPSVGDIVEVRSDKGSITNAPWEKKVVKAAGGRTFFDGGESHKLNHRNLIRSTLGEKGKRVFIYSH